MFRGEPQSKTAKVFTPLFPPGRFKLVFNSVTEASLHLRVPDFSKTAPQASPFDLRNDLRKLITGRHCQALTKETRAENYHDGLHDRPA